MKRQRRTWKSLYHVLMASHRRGPPPKVYISPSRRRVGSCQDRGPGLEHGGDPRLGDGDGLLLHGLSSGIRWIRSEATSQCRTKERHPLHGSLRGPLASSCRTRRCTPRRCRPAPWRPLPDRTRGSWGPFGEKHTLVLK